MPYLQDYIRQLEEDHPRWHCWWVPKAIGGFHWCAARWDHTAGPISADSPALLDEAIAEHDKKENP